MPRDQKRIENIPFERKFETSRNYLEQKMLKVIQVQGIVKPHTNKQTTKLTISFPQEMKTLMFWELGQRNSLTTKPEHCGIPRVSVFDIYLIKDRENDKIGYFLGQDTL